jgi:hypothetical protein
MEKLLEFERENWVIFASDEVLYKMLRNVLATTAPMMTNAIPILI